MTAHGGPAQGRFIRDAGCVVMGAAACGAIIEWAGHRQWHLWDLSMVVDAAWRPYLGQRPGVDFISPLPVGFHALGAAALAIFGVSWSSFVHIAVAWACLCLAWEFTLLRTMGVSRGFALVLSLAICAVTLVQKSFLYHSSFTTPIAAVLITAALLLAQSPTSRLAAVSIAASSALLLLGKQNAVLHLLLVAGVAMASARLRVRVGIAMVLGLIAAIIVTMIVAGSIAPTVRSTVAAGAMRGRPNLTAVLGILNGLGPRAFVVDLATVALAMAPLLTRRGRDAIAHLAPAARLICLGAGAIALYGMATNNDLKMTDLPPLLVAVFIPVALAAPRGTVGDRAPLMRPELLLAGITAIGVMVGVTRVTLSGDASRVFASGPLMPAGGSGSFFEHLSAGPRLALIEEDLSAMTAQLAGRKDHVFFGPALEFAYAAHGFTPPTGMPVWWHPGTSYSPSAAGTIAARFAADPPRLAVFLPNDWPGMPQGIYDVLRTQYVARPAGSLVVFERRVPDGSGR